MVVSAKKKPLRKFRKNMRKRRNPATKLTSVRLSGRSIVPDKVQTKLIYSITNNQTLSAGAVFQQQIRAAGAFDPDPALGGQSPRGFAYFANLYSRYRVRAVKVKTEGTCSTNVGVTLAIGIEALNGYNAPPATVAEMNTERNYITQTRNQYLPFDLKKYYALAPLWGKTPREYASDEVFSSQVNTTPVFDSTIYITGQNNDASNVNVHVTTTVVYYIEFYSVKDNIPM